MEFFQIQIQIPILEFSELRNRRVARSAVRWRLKSWKITIRNKTTIPFDYSFAIPFQEGIPRRYSKNEFQVWIPSMIYMFIIRNMEKYILEMYFRI
jgi:hypothetical protein